MWWTFGRWSTPSSQPVNIPESSHGLPIPTSLPRDRLPWKKIEAKSRKIATDQITSLAVLHCLRAADSNMAGWRLDGYSWGLDGRYRPQKNGKSKDGLLTNNLWMVCYVSYSRTRTLWFLGTRCDLVILNTIIRPWAFERMAAINPCAEEFVPGLAWSGRTWMEHIIMFNDNDLGLGSWVRAVADVAYLLHWSKATCIIALWVLVRATWIHHIAWKSMKQTWLLMTEVCWATDICRDV